MSDVNLWFVMSDFHLSEINRSIGLKELSNSLLFGFKRVPQSSENRNRKRTYEQAYRDYVGYLDRNRDRILDILTDAVKDSLSVEEAKDIGLKLQDAFEGYFDKDVKTGKILFERLKSIENSLSAGEKIAITKKILLKWKEYTEDIRKDVISGDWSKYSFEEANDHTLVSQILSLSSQIVGSIVDDISWSSESKLTERNNTLIWINVLLLLRLVAYLKGKIGRESIEFTASWAQIVLSMNMPSIIST